MTVIKGLLLFRPVIVLKTYLLSVNVTCMLCYTKNWIRR